MGARIRARGVCAAGSGENVGERKTYVLIAIEGEFISAEHAAEILMYSGSSGQNFIDDVLGSELSALGCDQLSRTISTCTCAAVQSYEYSFVFTFFTNFNLAVIQWTRREQIFIDSAIKKKIIM